MSAIAQCPQRDRPGQAPSTGAGSLVTAASSGRAFRRESRRKSVTEMPDIVGARIAGQALKVVDVSRCGLLLQGHFRTSIDRALRIQLIRSDNSRTELTGRVARAFVAALSRDELIFGLGIRLDELMPWLAFEEDSMTFEEAAQEESDEALIQSAEQRDAPESRVQRLDAEEADENWVEVDTETGLVVPKSVIPASTQEDVSAEGEDDSWSSLGF